ncbi:hypothetical protein [Corynebacterium callunae]|uniref:HTH cro/C1-type domain-containing protein n=1 Tax=Corynebacterium callunae DSM 20147 TaxID=1121353 RepID=M1UFG0_9CORY|nr:hypothetical protein [Corynebacterium callunae]AGG66910.1 hypothetical protein H924_07340 [Corynebacterium callunae DSM 20147]
MTQAGIVAKAEKLRALQKALKFSDQQMADHIKCDRLTWRNAVSGGLVSPLTVAKVSAAFSTPFDTYFKLYYAEQNAA